MTELERLQQENDALKKDKIVYEEIQHRFETVFELSRLGNKIIDPDLNILQVNQSLVTMLGYERKEISSAPASLTMHQRTAVKTGGFSSKSYGPI